MIERITTTWQFIDRIPLCKRELNPTWWRRGRGWRNKEHHWKGRHYQTRNIPFIPFRCTSVILKKGVHAGIRRFLPMATIGQASRASLAGISCSEVMFERGTKRRAPSLSWTRVGSFFVFGVLCWRRVQYRKKQKGASENGELRSPDGFPIKMISTWDRDNRRWIVSEESAKSTDSNVLTRKHILISFSEK